MSFRDLNSSKPDKKYCYGNGMTLRDMNFRDKPDVTEEPEPEQKTVQSAPSTAVPKNTSIPNRNYPNQVVYSQNTNYPSMSVQMGYTNRSGFPPSQIPPEFQQSQHLRYPQSVYYSQRNVPTAPPPVPTPVPAPEKPQSQFLYYTQNNNTPVQPMTSAPPSPPEKPVMPVPPVPPPPAEPEKPDPSKFVEEYVPTPPPKMVKPAPVQKKPVRKPDNSDTDFGGFGGTFDDNPDQSTPIADIPVMNRIDDYKI